MTALLIRLFIQNKDDTKNPGVRSAYGKLCGSIGLICNVLLAVFKVAAGLLSGSIAITADAVNNLSDSASSVITLLGFKLSEKPADKGHPFGHARYEYIAALAVSTLIMAIGLGVLQSSVSRILAPAPVHFSTLSFLVLFAGILLKIWMARLNRSIGIKIDSGALQATYADSRNDVLATSAVLLSAVLSYFFGWNLDGWMGLSVAIFILVNGILLMRDTLNPLLGSAQNEDFVRMVQEKIEAVPGVLGTHDLLVHDYGPGHRFASAHVEMPADMDVMQSHDILDNIERDFLQNEQLHLTLHYDPIETREHLLDDARKRAVDALLGIDTRLHLHDFRFVAGKEHDNYIFDVLLPETVPLSPTQLVYSVETALQEAAPRAVHCHITVDRSYFPIQTGYTHSKDA